MTIERDEDLRGEEAAGAMSDLVQWPMIAFTSWWDAAIEAWQPERCPHHPEDCCDLAIPDPIEREGEHALFA